MQNGFVVTTPDVSENSVETSEYPPENMEGEEKFFMAVTKELPGPERIWTPTAFTAAANACFRAAISEKRNRAGVEIREGALQFPS